MPDLKRQRLGVVMGGVTGEREVSLRSGAAIATALRQRGFTVQEVVVSGRVIQELLAADLEVAFLALHGGFGEDGRIQALCELMGLAYTGSGVLASALAMHKESAKALFQAQGIPTPRHCRAEEPDQVMSEMQGTLPLVIKPVAEGSSLGVSVVERPEDLGHALAAARRYGPDILAEEYIAGREVTVGVLDGEPLGVVEMIPREGFYDYRAKYQKGETEYIAPAELPRAMSERLRELGQRAYRALAAAAERGWTSASSRSAAPLCWR
jgi:D-alanine-D-alanine ligase